MPGHGETRHGIMSGMATYGNPTVRERARRLLNATDEPLIPHRMRMAIVHYAVAQWFRDRGSDARGSEAYNEYATIVKRGQADYREESDRMRLMPQRRHRASSLRLGSGNYSTGTEFEDLRI
mgnify:CR=1 FL=1